MSSRLAFETADPIRRGAVLTGRILGALVTAALLADAGVALVAPHLLAASLQETGFALDLGPVIGSIGLVCIVLYAIPQTCVLGAVAVTAFLGGAICAHLRLGEIGSPPQIVSLLLGVSAWAALWLRLSGVRAVFPLAHLREVSK
jgi:hypothetical protein